MADLYVCSDPPCDGTTFRHEDEFVAHVESWHPAKVGSEPTETHPEEQSP